MICGDDISRIPETTKPDFECNKEEEKPTYAAVARSRPTSECNPEEPVVEDVEDPVVEDVAEPVKAAPTQQAAPAEPEEQKQSRAERKTKKAMMKLGLTAVEGSFCLVSVFYTGSRYQPRCPPQGQDTPVRRSKPRGLPQGRYLGRSWRGPR